MHSSRICGRLAGAQSGPCVVHIIQRSIFNAYANDLSFRMLEESAEISDCTATERRTCLEISALVSNSAPPTWARLESYFSGSVRRALRYLSREPSRHPAHVSTPSMSKTRWFARTSGLASWVATRSGRWRRRRPHPRVAESQALSTSRTGTVGFCRL
jgi:hypothetical protein